MPDLTDMLKIGGGPFLSAKNTQDLTEGKVVGGGKIDVGEFRGKTQRRLLIPIDIAGKQYTYAAGMGKVRILADAWGEDSDKWVDKTVVFRHAPSAFGLSLVALPPEHPLTAKNIPAPVLISFIPGQRK